MNLSGLVYKLMTGEWRIDRERAREHIEFARRMEPIRRAQLYAGANPGLNRPTPAILSTPEDFRQAYERIVLIRAARQLEEDMPFFDGILGDFETYVVGDLTYRASTGNPDADREINSFLEWQFDVCDFKRQMDLTKLAKLSVRSYKRDGECGYVLVNTAEGIRINAISGDRIGNPLVGANIGPNNYNGIITDDSGAPSYYAIYRRIPKLNSYVFQMNVDANDFIHYFSPFRFEQYHGVTVFMNAIEHGFDMKQIYDFTKLNIKYRSSQLPYVTNEQGKPRGTGYEMPVTTASDGQPRPFDVQVGPGVTQSFLKLGEGVMEYPNDFPNQQYRAIMDDLKRDVAIGAKLPLEFCYRSDTGGVVQRFYVNKAEQTFNEEKRWLRRTILTRYKNRSIQWGIDSGFLDLSSFGNLSTDIARFRGTWQMGKALSVDYKNEVQADMLQIDASVMSEEEYALEQGRDIETVRLQKKEHVKAILADAQEISKELNLPLELVLPYLQKKFPNPGTAGSAENPDPTGGKGGEPVNVGTR